ncbi:hypothetical protein BDE36_0202 [Arcticibacter tournemirensis]|uniref:HNH endonuclease n=1 Tax=Arcticibacter tournemirensis TaxID=699437 RepID=A0A5M9GLV8_9SPHI|nr:hypothetical protein [Arcticibacter tournemirensis]KAA8473718.1 hypothetical protein F1649_22625 [Arcticibacter tournemirensis]TQM48518.1 hypothetical protein BDE36_0202 [Arcticibacter tournemirensis]
MKKVDNKNNRMSQQKCALCGKHELLTFEHIPPQCAFNNKAIFVQSHEHLTEENSYLYGKMKKSQRGFGKQSLCASCNNSTGNWYVKDFCSFAEQGMKILKDNKVPEYIQGNYIIKPQNVIKQILIMFLAADSLGAIRDSPGISEYLLNRESMAWPEKVNIYLYSNSSPKKRMLGYCIVGDIGAQGVYKWSEINYQPFGYFFTYDSPPPNEFMINISDFSKVPYNIEKSVQITTAYLKVENMLIGHYANI